MIAQAIGFVVFGVVLGFIIEFVKLVREVKSNKNPYKKLFYENGQQKPNRLYSFYQSLRPTLVIVAIAYWLYQLGLFLRVF